MSKDAKFDEFATETLPDKVAKHLLQMIVEGKLKPGEKLPPERDLAAMMNVGRTSLRGALRALELMNVIEIRQGSGTHISSLRADHLVEHLEFVFRLDDSTVIQLFHARKLIEAGLVRLAAQNVTDDDLANLQACLQPAIDNPHANNAFYEADVSFHNLIARIANNPFLERCFTAVAKLGMTPRMEIGRMPGVLERANNDHIAILEALRTRDPDQAEQAMLKHLNFAEQNLRDYVAQQSDRTGQS